MCGVKSLDLFIEFLSIFNKGCYCRKVRINSCIILAKKINKNSTKNINYVNYIYIKNIFKYKTKYLRSSTGKNL